MPTQSAQASLSSAFTIVPITGFINYSNGIIDIVTGAIKAQGRSRWGNIKKWSSFINYITERDPIKWTAPVLDLGSVDYFNLEVTTEFDGTLKFFVHVSETGEFAGEESEYLIEDGTSTINSFYGRFVYVTAIVQGTTLSRMSIQSSREFDTIKLTNVNTATLSGTNTARVLSLPRTVSGIYDMDIQVKAMTPYAVDMYVSNTPTSKVGIPVVVSKSATSPTIAVYGIDNQPRDATVDVTLTVLNRMVMNSGRIVVIR